jgi:hypothetical protein
MTIIGCNGIGRSAGEGKGSPASFKNSYIPFKYKMCIKNYKLVFKHNSSNKIIQLYDYEQVAPMGLIIGL